MFAWIIVSLSNVAGNMTGWLPVNIQNERKEFNTNFAASRLTNQDLTIKMLWDIETYSASLVFAITYCNHSRLMFVTSLVEDTYCTFKISLSFFKWFKQNFAITVPWNDSGEILLSVTIGFCIYVLAKPQLQLSVGLTHWGRNKINAILQTPFSNAFSWMKMFEFRLKFHWSLFLKVQLTIFQHWFR